MKKALVLGGGGSKGAYEIGVWKALDELNIKFVKGEIDFQILILT